MAFIPTIFYAISGILHFVINTFWEVAARNGGQCPPYGYHSISVCSSCRVGIAHHVVAFIVHKSVNYLRVFLKDAQIQDVISGCNFK